MRRVIERQMIENEHKLKPKRGWFHAWMRDSDGDICGIIERDGGIIEIWLAGAVIFKDSDPDILDSL